MQDLEGKVAVVTGGASGLGLAMAQRFGSAGMKVVIGDIETARSPMPKHPSRLPVSRSSAAGPTSPRAATSRRWPIRL